MATNVSFTMLNGDPVTVDAELVTGVAALADPLGAGVSRGSRITRSVGPTVDVAESVQLIMTTVVAALTDNKVSAIGDSVDASLGSAGPFTLAALTLPAAGGIITIPTDGRYLCLAKGDVRNSDVSDCYPTVRWMKNSAGVGGTASVGVLAFGTDTGTVMSGSNVGPFIDDLVAGDTIALGVSVTPGGVAGDEITIINYSILAILLRA